MGGGPTPSPGKASKAQAVPLGHPPRASSMPPHCTLMSQPPPGSHTQAHTVTHSHPQPLPT